MEFISLKYGNINVKSAIFSEYVLQNIMNIDFMIDLIISLIKACEKGRSVNPLYADLQKEIIRFSFIDRVFKRKRIGNRYKDIYDGIKELPSMARNPQFWLQYAIARLENGAFQAAEIHFRTAYSHASRRQGYDTFQIDNHYARFLLESRINDPSYLDDFKAFIDAHALLSKQAKKEKDAYYPYKVARNYSRFFEARGAKYDKDQRETVRRACIEIVELSKGISRGANKYYIIDECRVELSKLINVLESMRTR